MMDFTLLTRRGGVGLSSAVMAALAACGGGAETNGTAAQPDLLLAETVSASASQTVSGGAALATQPQAVNVASCGFSEVQVTVKAASSGVTVQIPAGVYLRGAGQDVTVPTARWRIFPT